MSKSPITTHVLDLAHGRAAAGIPVLLESQHGTSWKSIGQGATNADGRVENLLPPAAPLERGQYRLSFDTKAYFDAQGGKTFYPYVCIAFEVANTGEHYHVPLLLSPYGYSTYRGS